MDFSLSAEQKMFRAMFREFAEKEVAPAADQTDKSEQPPMALLDKAAAQGFMGATLPEDYGGIGLDWISFLFLIEELAQKCLSTSLTIGLHLARAAMAVAEAGSPEQKETYLPLLASGEAIGAYAFTEPESGSDLSSLQTVAVRRAGIYVLDGTKTWVGSAGIAGLFLVFAATDPGAGQQGISAFIVRRDNPGLTVGYREPTLGLRGMGVHTVYFENCQVPESDRLGAENAAWEIGLRAEDRTRLVIAAAALGAAQAAHDLGIQFSLEREQFGGPIARKGAIQNLVAETAVEIEALRWTVQHAAWLADNGQDFRQAASMAKFFAGRVARDAANRMIQVTAGTGYMEDFPMARIYRDVRALRILGGTDEVQKFLVARELYEEEDLHLSI